MLRYTRRDTQGGKLDKMSLVVALEKSKRKDGQWWWWWWRKEEGDVTAKRTSRRLRCILLGVPSNGQEGCL